MNAKGDANRSVRMTKQRLYQALITLLQQKSRPLWMYALRLQDHQEQTL